MNQSPGCNICSAIFTALMTVENTQSHAVPAKNVNWPRERLTETPSEHARLAHRGVGLAEYHKGSHLSVWPLLYSVPDQVEHSRVGNSTMPIRSIAMPYLRSNVEIAMPGCHGYKDRQPDSAFSTRLFDPEKNMESYTTVPFMPQLTGLDTSLRSLDQHSVYSRTGVKRHESGATSRICIA
jgi:hypothetical protein